jgi:DNA-binding transcriptional MerR regulator
MTSIEFCQSAGLTPRELQNWLESGLLEAELVVIPGAAGRRREFIATQVERARVIKALHMKGVTLPQLARANLTFEAGQAFVIFDGRELRACRDAAAANRRSGAHEALVQRGRPGRYPRGRCGMNRSFTTRYRAWTFRCRMPHPQACHIKIGGNLSVCLNHLQGIRCDARWPKPFGRCA